MAKEKTLPSIKETAFVCPHCGAYTTQYWFALHARQLDEKRPTPLIPGKEWMEWIQKQSVPGEKQIPDTEKEHLMDCTTK